MKENGKETPLLNDDEQTIVNNYQHRGKQGHPLSTDAKATAINVANVICKNLGVHPDKAIKSTANALGHSPRTIRLALEELKSTGQLTTVQQNHIGRGNPDHPLNTNNTNEYGPSLEAEILIHNLLHLQKTKDKSITSTTIIAWAAMQ